MKGKKKEMKKTVRAYPVQNKPFKYYAEMASDEYYSSPYGSA